MVDQPPLQGLDDGQGSGSADRGTPVFHRALRSAKPGLRSSVTPTMGCLRSTARMRGPLASERGAEWTWGGHVGTDSRTARERIAVVNDDTLFLELMHDVLEARGRLGRRGLSRVGQCLPVREGPSPPSW